MPASQAGRRGFDPRLPLHIFIDLDAIWGSPPIPADFPPDESELEAAHLHTASSVHVKTPRIAEAQVSLECTLYSPQPLGANTLIISHVVMFHVADPLVGPRMHIEGFAPIGRLGSPSVYCRTADRFEVPRLTYSGRQKASS